jgi:hypothetical protein
MTTAGGGGGGDVSAAAARGGQKTIFIVAVSNVVELLPRCTAQTPRIARMLLSLTK